MEKECGYLKSCHGIGTAQQLRMGPSVSCHINITTNLSHSAKFGAYKIQALSFVRFALGNSSQDFREIEEGGFLIAYRGKVKSNS